jgi:hypothetical protein
MKKRWKRMRRVFTSVVLAGLAVGAMGAPAAAHEGREVGEYVLVVGFGEEPAYAAFQNSVQFLVSHHDTEEPVTRGVAGTVSVEVVFGEETTEMALEPRFGEPGDYRAYFIPSRPGTYTFHFTGAINGQEIDEEFTSGPNTFSDVLDSAEAQFPVQDPSVAEVAERLDREIPRLTERLDAVEAAMNESQDTGLQEQVAALEDDLAGARTVAFVGIVVGAIGLLVGATALLWRRKA